MAGITKIEIEERSNEGFMAIEVDDEPVTLPQQRPSKGSDQATLPGDADFLDKARFDLKNTNSNQPTSVPAEAEVSPSEIEQSVNEIRQLDLKRYFADAKKLSPQAWTPALNLYLEYALHFSEKNLINQAGPLSPLMNSERIQKLDTRMQAIETRLKQLGIPTAGLQTLGNSIENLLGPISASPLDGTLRATLVVEKAPELVAAIMQSDTISFASRVTEEMGQTHQILDPVKYFYGGRATAIAPQLRSRFDRASEPLPSRHAGRHFRSSEEANLATKIDCSHYAWYQRQAVARAAGMSEEWIKKNIVYKTSDEMAAHGCMSVRKALSNKQLREGDVLVYPGHAGVVGRDKNGALCIMESTTGRNSRSGVYETGVQISDFNAWVNQRIGKPASKFVVYRDRIPAVG